MTQYYMSFQRKKLRFSFVLCSLIRTFAEIYKYNNV